MEFGDSLYVRKDLKKTLKKWKDNDLPFDYTELTLSGELVIDRNFEDDVKFAGIHYKIFIIHLPEVDFSPQSLKKTKKIINIFCKMTRCKGFNIHLFSSRIKLDMKRKVIFLEKVADYVRKKGAFLTLENTEESPKMLNKFFKLVPKDLYFCLDIGHANLFTKNNYSVEFMETLGDKLKLVHVHDNFGGNSEESDKHLSLGKGNIDLKRIFHNLNSIGFEGFITFELPWSSKREKIASVNKVKKLLV